MYVIRYICTPGGMKTMENLCLETRLILSPNTTLFFFVWVGNCLSPITTADSCTESYYKSHRHCSFYLLPSETFESVLLQYPHLWPGRSPPPYHSTIPGPTDSSAILWNSTFDIRIDFHCEPKNVTLLFYSNSFHQLRFHCLYKSSMQ